MAENCYRFSVRDDTTWVCDNNGNEGESGEQAQDSPLSIFNVTLDVSDTFNEGLRVYAQVLDLDNDHIADHYDIEGGTSSTFSIVAVNGVSVLDFFGEATLSDITGDVIFDDEQGRYVVQSDCSADANAGEHPVEPM